MDNGERYANLTSEQQLATALPFHNRTHEVEMDEQTYHTAPPYPGFINMKLRQAAIKSLLHADACHYDNGFSPSWHKR